MCGKNTIWAVILLICILGEKISDYDNLISKGFESNTFMDKQVVSDEIQEYENENLLEEKIISYDMGIWDKNETVQENYSVVQVLDRSTVNEELKNDKSYVDLGMKYPQIDMQNDFIEQGLNDIFYEFALNGFFSWDEQEGVEGYLRDVPCGYYSTRYVITYADEMVLSICMEAYVNGTWSGTNMIKGLTVSLETGEVLSLEDIGIKEGELYERFCEYPLYVPTGMLGIKEYLNGEKQEGYLEVYFEAWEEQEKHIEDYYISDKGIGLIVNDWGRGFVVEIPMDTRELQGTGIEADKIWIVDGSTISLYNYISFSFTDLENGELLGNFSTKHLAELDNINGTLSGTVSEDKAICRFQDQNGDSGNMTLYFVDKSTIKACIEYDENATGKDIGTVEGTYMFKPYNLSDWESVVVNLEQSFRVDLDKWGEVYFIAGINMGRKPCPVTFLVNDDYDILFQLSTNYKVGTEVCEI